MKDTLLKLGDTLIEVSSEELWRYEQYTCPWTTTFLEPPRDERIHT